MNNTMSPQAILSALKQDTIELKRADNSSLPIGVSLPSREQCRQFFDQYHVPHNIRIHCGRVHRVACVIARALADEGVELNIEFVERLALLHDLFKVIGIKDYGTGAHKGELLSSEQVAFWQKMKEQFPNHNEADVAYEVFRVDYPELAVALKCLGKSTIQDSYEQMIVHYSDFRVFQNKVVSIEERLVYLQNQYPHHPSWWAAYARDVLAIESKLFELLPFLPDELCQAVDEMTFEHTKVLP